MGMKRTTFGGSIIAGISAVTALASGHSSANPIFPPKPPIVHIETFDFDSASIKSEPTATLNNVLAGSDWAPQGSIPKSVERIHSGSGQANWSRLTNSSRSSRGATASPYGMGLFRNMRSSFNRDTAVVLMDIDRGWRSSARISGRQFSSPATNWSTFRTEWKAPSYTHSNAEWKPSHQQRSRYRTVSEFCSTDISVEVKYPNSCVHYSGPILSILRAVNIVMNWVKSMLGDDSAA